jgi:Flp pilus assembly protein TadG
MRHSMRREDGQATAELALVLPVLLGLVVATVQLGLVFKDYLALTDAVRAAARKAAVSRGADDPEGLARRALVTAAADLDADSLELDVESTWEADADVTVSASYPYRISLFGVVVAEGRVASTTTGRVE